MSKKKTHRVLISVNIEPELYEQGKELAARQERSFSEMIRYMIKKELILDKKN